MKVRLDLLVRRLPKTPTLARPREHKSLRWHPDEFEQELMRIGGWRSLRRREAHLRFRVSKVRWCWRYLKPRLFAPVTGVEVARRVVGEVAGWDASVVSDRQLRHRDVHPTVKLCRSLVRQGFSVQLVHMEADSVELVLHRACCGYGRLGYRAVEEASR